MAPNKTLITEWFYKNTKKKGIEKKEDRKAFIQTIYFDFFSKF